MVRSKQQAVDRADLLATPRESPGFGSETSSHDEPSNGGLEVKGLVRSCFLGTSADVPPVERGLPALIVLHRHRRFLVECGEGTQSQLLQSGLGFRRLDCVLFTHASLDHVLGIGGLVATHRPAAGELRVADARANFPMHWTKISGRLLTVYREPALLAAFDTCSDAPVARLPACRAP
jgi:glyoxylase-like metal-dependent hydrolase (beta-lactamase superfamily II)